MKKYRKILILLCVILLCVLLFFLISNLFKRDAKEKENFIKIAEEDKYNVVNISRDFEEYRNIDTAIAAVAAENWEIRFFQTEKEENAKELYSTFKNQLSSLEIPGKKESDMSKKHQEKYTQDNNEYYIYLARKKNSILYVFVPVEHRKEAENFVKKFAFVK